MKTFTSIKNLILSLSMAFAFVSSAGISENTLELLSVRSIDAQKSELSFKRSFINLEGKQVTQTIKATDDDGVLSVAAINFHMMQKISEAVFQKAQTESPAAAREEWERVKGKAMARFPSVKPALLNSLAKLAAYSSAEVKKMKLAKRVAENKGDFLTAGQLDAKIILAEAEGAKALEAHKEIAKRDAITPKEFSDIVGKLLNEHGINHSYATSVDGAAALVFPLVDTDVNNPLGFFFASRPLQMNDDVLRMTDARGAIDFAANVLQEIQTANGALPEATPSLHNRLPSLDGEFVEKK